MGVRSGVREHVVASALSLAPGAARRSSCEQAEGVQVEAAGQGVDGVQGQIALAALDARQVAGRHSQVLGEGLLRQGAAVPLGA